jgi:sterol desaturase/sphingolipid hydroxylase (fatty acid hydroxylase superfamily)
MSAWNSVHHISEEILRVPFIVIPMSLLIHVDPGFAPAIVWILLGIHGQYVHSHARLHFGPLRYAIADNRFHRIHHSVEREHFNKNFGSFSSVWDSLFGTAHFPKKDEWPQTGIDEHDEAKTVSEYLFRPFRKLFAKA